MNSGTEVEPPPGTAPLAEEKYWVQLLRRAMPVLVDLWIVVVWFALAGVIGAVLWSQLTPLVTGPVDEQELTKQIASDGWFFVIAGVGGLLSGSVLALWRRRTPELIVLMVAAAGALSTWLMLGVGGDLGPDNFKGTLGDLAAGQQVPLQVASHGLYLIWSIAALLGAALVLLVGELFAAQKRHNQAMKAFRESEAAGQFAPSDSPYNG